MKASSYPGANVDRKLTSWSNVDCKFARKLIKVGRKLIKVDRKLTFALAAGDSRDGGSEGSRDARVQPRPGAGCPPPLSRLRTLRGGPVYFDTGPSVLRRAVPLLYTLLKVSPSPLLPAPSLGKRFRIKKSACLSATSPSLRLRPSHSRVIPQFKNEIFLQVTVGAINSQILASHEVGSPYPGTHRVFGTLRFSIPASKMVVPAFREMRSGSEEGS